MNGTTEDVFTNIYRGNLWNTSPNTSGPGSTLQYTTDVRSWLADTIRSLGSVRALYSAGCGYFDWYARMEEEHGELLTPLYFGVDIVRDVISYNASRFGDSHHWFSVSDFTVEPPPDVCDVILCRHALQHLPANLVEQALTTFERSGATWFIGTTYRNEFSRDPGDTEVGGYFPYDLERQFGYTSPLTYFKEPNPEHDELLAVWRLK